MSISLSFRFSSDEPSALTTMRRAPTAPFTGQKGPWLTTLRRRLAERQMVRALETLGHPGVIADFRQASRR